MFVSVSWHKLYNYFKLTIAELSSEYSILFPDEFKLSEKARNSSLLENVGLKLLIIFSALCAPFDKRIYNIPSWNFALSTQAAILSSIL